MFPWCYKEPLIKNLHQLVCITHLVNLRLHVNMHTKGGKSQTEETEDVQTCNSSKRMPNAVLQDGWCSFNEPTADTGVHGREVVCTQCLADSDQSYRRLVEVTESPQQPDDRTHSVKADKSWTNTHRHTPLTHSVTPCVQTVEEEVMKERRAADELCVLDAWMCGWVTDRKVGEERNWFMTLWKILHKTSCLRDPRVSFIKNIYIE